MKRLALLFAFIALAFFAAPVFAQDAGVAKLTYGPDKWIAVHMLLQTQYQGTRTWDTTAKETDSDAEWANSMRIRRARIIVQGQAASFVDFFVETDDINRGGRANDATGTTSTYIQDAYINFKIAPELNITMGMILLPFTHNNRQSAASLLGVDYAMVDLNSNILYSTRVWRDTGIEFRGLLFGGIIDYRMGVFQGLSRNTLGNTDRSDDINPDALPRFTGRMQINILDPEDGFFYSGNYLGKKKIVSFGGGVDYQADVTNLNIGNTDDQVVKDYFAWTADVTIDVPLAQGMAFALQGAYIHMDNQPTTTTNTAYSTTAVGANGIEKQYGYFVQAGLLLFDTIQPVVRYTRWYTGHQLMTGTTEYDNSITSYLTVGLNYFINGHNANIKIEYRHGLGETQNGVDQDDQPNQNVFTLQGQIFI